MDRFGLIGDPIKTSGSPALFRAAYSDKVQADGTPYGYDLIEGSDFESSYSRFLSDYKAINVTAPYKEKAYARVLALAAFVIRISTPYLEFDDILFAEVIDNDIGARLIPRLVFDIIISNTVNNGLEI